MHVSVTCLSQYTLCSCAMLASGNGFIHLTAVYRMLEVFPESNIVVRMEVSEEVGGATRDGAIAECIHSKCRTYVYYTLHIPLHS